MKPRICIVSAEHSPYGGIGHALRRQVELLEERYEVTFIEQPEPSEAISRLSFASEDHQRSAAVLEQIERTYGDRGPDLLEVTDYRALGLVPLQARRAGHGLLRDTTFAVRVSSTAELLALHDRRSLVPEERRIVDLEREQLRLADRLLWPGGEILDLYRRYYRGLDLPPAIRVPRPFPAPEAPPPPEPAAAGPLRILFVGRMQRLKGTADLVEACLRLGRDDWQLTLIGDDTDTGPLGQSVRLTIETMCAGDPRVRIEGPVPHEELQQRWREHHLVVVPSTFEVCSNVALEAMRAGVPVLATPVGAQTEMVQPGANGWLTAGVGPEAIGASLEELLADREEVERVRLSGQVFESFQGFTDPTAFLDAYSELLGKQGDVPPVFAASPPAREPLVSAVVPYFKGARFVSEAVASLLDQTHERLEVWIVNDGSFDLEDEVLEKLAGDRRVRVVTQLNRGDLAARELGIHLSQGEYVLMFDADNVLEPEFVARALTMLQKDPELAYVTAWLRFFDAEGIDLGQGYAPLGNRVLRDEEENWDGDTSALIPRRVLDDLSPIYPEQGAIHGDWQLYRRLRARDAYGAVIPERLIRYRVHPQSLLRAHDRALHRRSWEEARDARKLTETRWAAS